MSQRGWRFTGDALAGVAGGATINNTAERLGCDRRTVSRIVNCPEGRAALAELWAASLDHAAARLVGLVDLAADTLASVMGDIDAAPAARVGAPPVPC